MQIILMISKMFFFFSNRRDGLSDMHKSWKNMIYRAITKINFLWRNKMFGSDRLIYSRNATHKEFKDSCSTRSMRTAKIWLNPRMYFFVVILAFLNQGKQFRRETVRSGCQVLSFWAIEPLRGKDLAEQRIVYLLWQVVIGVRDQKTRAS